MIAVAVGRSWQASWWEWHVLMLVAFGLIAWAAHREWHEERFSPLYGDETAAGDAGALASSSPTSRGSPPSRRRTSADEVGRDAERATSSRRSRRSNGTPVRSTA